jgi:hypothetical protein
VCEPICWNKKAGLCEACAPNLEEEKAAAQAQQGRSRRVVPGGNFVRILRRESCKREILSRVRQAAPAQEALRQMRRRSRRRAEVLPRLRAKVRLTII